HRFATGHEIRRRRESAWLAESPQPPRSTRSPRMKGERRTTDSIDRSCGSAPLAEARFVPQRYEPNYAYPLLILLHGRGADENQLVRAMPSMSWRNYVGLGLRGPEPVVRRGLDVGYGWGPEFARPDRRPSRSRPKPSEAEIVGRLLRGEPADAIDA